MLLKNLLVCYSVFKNYYVFSTVQRYGDFRTPTIALLWHIAYQTFGMSDFEPFFLIEKAVFSMRKSRSFYQRKPFFLKGVFCETVSLFTRMVEFRPQRYKE